MEHKEHKIMKTKTIKLKNYLKQINSNYENVRSTGEQKDFYTVIQPFVDEVPRRLDPNQSVHRWQQRHR